LYGKGKDWCERLSIQQNSFWAMFYAEFHHLHNFLVDESMILFPRFMGFEWEIQGRVFPKIVSETCTNVRFTSMVTVLHDFLDCVYDNTPCLNSPIGSQHMYPSLLQRISDNFDITLKFFCANDCFLKKCDQTGKTKNVNRKKSASMKLVLKSWQMLRKMIMNLHHIFSIACVVTETFSKMLSVENMLRVYDDDILQKCKSEDPFFWGYRLRKNDIIRSIQENVPVSSVFLPFDFLQFVYQLSKRTSCAITGYLPIFQNLEAKISDVLSKSDEIISRSKNSNFLYVDSWISSLSKSYESSMIFLKKRMFLESRKYKRQLNFRYPCRKTKCGLTIEVFNKMSFSELQKPEFVSILSRLAILQEKKISVEFKNFGCDDFLKRNSKESCCETFKIWFYREFLSSFGSSLFFGKKLKKFERSSDFLKKYSKRQFVKKQLEKSRSIYTQKEKAVSKIIVFYKNKKRNQKVNAASLILKRFFNSFSFYLKNEKTRLKFRLFSKKLKIKFDLKFQKENISNFLNFSKFKKKIFELFQIQEKFILKKCFSNLKNYSNACKNAAIVQQKKIQEIRLMQRKHHIFLNNCMLGLIQQLEYFLVVNIQNDYFLLKHIQADGSIQFGLLISFPTIKNYTSNFPDELHAITMAAYKSKHLEVTGFGIRRKIFTASNYYLY